MKLAESSARSRLKFCMVITLDRREKLDLCFSPVLAHMLTLTAHSLV